MVNFFTISLILINTYNANHTIISLSPCLIIMTFRIIIILLSIFATILPVHAQGEIFTDGDFTFRVISDNECEVTGSPNPPNPLVIPSTATFNGNVYTVTRIGSAAFFDRKACVIVYHGEGTYFGDLVLPNTITSIGDSAFMNCKGLTGSLNNSH